MTDTHTRRGLSIRGAQRRYVKETAALAGADLDLEPGKITALLGPSGSGKSTLLRAIAGLERLDGGEIRLGDTVWAGPGRHLAPERRRVGMVFQDYALFPHLDALANVAFGLKGPDAKAIAMAQLEAAELGHKAKAFPHELSGGEQQRVALARALVMEPAVVMADEPTGNLDSETSEAIHQLFFQLNTTRRTTFLIVTHSRDLAARMPRVVSMKDGKVLT
ncbi:MAG: ABC transporter, partial [Maricaulis sp.]|nr:ABC transporter [Maricaulis sp.]